MGDIFAGQTTPTSRLLLWSQAPLLRQSKALSKLPTLSRNHILLHGCELGTDPGALLFCLFSLEAFKIFFQELRKSHAITESPFLLEMPWVRDLSLA